MPGFEIAKAATEREDLQLRMQGNAFLGAFFKVSSFLEDNAIEEHDFHRIVNAQYRKKFGRFGDDVVTSNMRVMEEGFNRVVELPYGQLDDLDISSMRGPLITPFDGVPEYGCNLGKAPLHTTASFDREFRAGLGYNQLASPRAAVGVVAAATGATASKYVARRQVPMFIAENCTQCMACITACPDTALPNAALDINTVLKSAIVSYVEDRGVRGRLLEGLDDLTGNVRSRMNALLAEKNLDVPFSAIVLETLEEAEQANPSLNHGALDVLKTMLPKLPLSYSRTNAIFKMLEKKDPGAGGLFSIFVNDLCKGCGECATECGDHDALRMVDETDLINGEHNSAMRFMDTLPDTPAKYLGKYNYQDPQETIAAALKNHLMVRSYYDALVSGDGACAGCGEKSILRAIATLTEALMRPRFHQKAARQLEKAEALERKGVKLLEKLKQQDPQTYEILTRTVAHVIMHMGREKGEQVMAVMQERQVKDEQLVEALVMVLRQDAYNHRDLQAIDGRLANGMAAMAMAAHTGCNTVYGSTPPNNPHPYPWMNSLFQDGATIGWIMGETFIVDHAKRSVIPERLADMLLNGDALTEEDYFLYTHFSDLNMTGREVGELPKVWVVGGDGGMGDIGFQNVSKAVLQNRPNVKMLLLDTQVYSNTGGQNSDSSVMAGGFDMNQLGAATQGKLTEKKSVSEILTVGHGSPYVAQVSMANSSNLYKAIIEGLEYRGTAFIQSYTSCQPEHGVPDFASTQQAQLIRDSRGMPEFISNPDLGELTRETLSLKGNPSVDRDWYQKTIYKTTNKFAYTVAHWALTEARFRYHHKKISEQAAEGMISLDDMLGRIVQRDVVQRRFLDPSHRAFIPDWGVYLLDYSAHGTPAYHALSRQMVLFCVERRKAWRMLQSRAGIVNQDYATQKQFLKDYDEGRLDQEDSAGPMSSTNGEAAKA